MAFHDMATQPTCPKCGKSSLRHSRWRPSDGLLRPLVMEPVRCQLCGDRRYQFSPWRTSATLIVLLLLALLVGIVAFAITNDEPHARPAFGLEQNSPEPARHLTSQGSHPGAPSIAVAQADRPYLQSVAKSAGLA